MTDQSMMEFSFLSVPLVLSAAGVITIIGRSYIISMTWQESDESTGADTQASSSYDMYQRCIMTNNKFLSDQKDWVTRVQCGLSKCFHCEGLVRFSIGTLDPETLLDIV